MKIDINVDAILAKRGLGSDMRAGRELAETAKKLMEKHVPMRVGTLKNSAQLQNQYPKVLIIYNTPYAHYQYVGKAMGPSPKLKNGEWKSLSGQKKHYTGKELTYSGAPRRGKEWDKKMLAAQKIELLEGVAAITGGKVKP